MGQADHARTTRRGMLAATFALSTAAGAGVVLAADAALRSDAALFLLEPGLQRLVQAEDAAIDVCWLLEAKAHDLADAHAPKPSPAWRTALDTASHEVGFTAAETAVASASRALIEACAALAGMRAETLDGLRMKARFAQHCDELADSIVEDLLAMGGFNQGENRGSSV